jgi:hypothetical protein
MFASCKPLTTVDQTQLDGESTQVGIHGWAPTHLHRWVTDDGLVSQP